jgi:hypothetical protein
MKSLVVFAFLIFSSHHLIAQHIIRSSIGAFGSISKAGIHPVISGNPISSPILKGGNKSEGISIQTRPFVHLKSNQSAKDLVIDFYPNPTTDLVHIKTREEYTAVSIIDIFGKICYTGMATEISMTDLSAGMYTINLTLLDNSIYSTKLILIK